MGRSRMLAAAVVFTAVLLSTSGASGASVRSCGELRGAEVAILKGPVKCRTARRVLRYAASHHYGNGPASPEGWQCFRIVGDPHWTGLECISPPGAEAHPRNHIALRGRYQATRAPASG